MLCQLSYCPSMTPSARFAPDVIGRNETAVDLLTKRSSVLRFPAGVEPVTVRDLRRSEPAGRCPARLVLLRLSIVPLRQNVLAKTEESSEDRSLAGAVVSARVRAPRSAAAGDAARPRLATRPSASSSGTGCRPTWSCAPSGPRCPPTRASPGSGWIRRWGCSRPTAPRGRAQLARSPCRGRPVGRHPRRIPGCRDRSAGDAAGPDPVRLRREPVRVRGPRHHAR